MPGRHLDQADQADAGPDASSDAAGVCVMLALEAFANSLPHIVWITSMTGDPLFFNRRWTQFTGRSFRADDREVWREYVHPDDLASACRGRDDAFVRRTPYAIEYRLLRHDGVYGWFRESGEPRYDETGAFAGYTCSCANVSARRLAESALHDSEDRFRNFIANAPAVAFVKTADGRYAWVNNAFKDAFGLVATSVLNRTDTEFYGAITGRALRANDERVIARGMPERLEETTWHNGQERAWLSHKFPLRQSDGQLYLGGVSVDITEIKRSERQLRENAVRLKVAFGAARMAPWTWDHVAGEFHAPEGMAAVFGVVDRQRWSNGELLALIHPDDRAAARAAGLRALKDGDDYQIEARVVWPDGSLHWIESHGAWERDAEGNLLRLMGVTINVTARKTAELTLREKDELLRLGMDAARMVAWHWDPATRDFCSTYDLGALFGVPGRERWHDDEILAAIHPLDRARVRDAGRTALDRGGDYYAKFRVVHPGGSVHWIEARGQWQPSGPSEGRMLIGIASDVTARELANRALAESEQRLHLALGAARMASWTWTAATDRVSSQNVGELYGLGAGPSELPMRAYFDCIHPDDRPAVEASWNAVIAQPRPHKRPLTNEFRVVDHGKLRWLEVRATLQFDSEGQLTGLLGVTTDVTPRKQAEIALREANTQLRVAMDSARMSSWIWNIATGEYISQGDGLRVLFDLGPDTPVTNATLLECVVEEDRPALMATVTAALDDSASGDYPFVLEYRIKHRDGGLRWVECRGRSYRDERGRVRQLIGTTTDVTQRRHEAAERERLQFQLQQAQKMESIGHLTGGIAHDFNNILTSVLGYSGLALRRYSGQLPPKLVEYLREVQTAGERARDLVAQMLAFSRGEHGTLHQVDLASLLSGAIKMLRPMLPASIEVRTEVTADLPPALSDEVQLQQVIVNLCINARDAMIGSGAIAFGLTRATLRRQACASCHQDVAGDFIALTVRDTGCGISPHIAGRMFEPFFTTKEPGKGTGMGLPMVHGIVHRQGGHVLVESAAPGGTMFMVLLPVAPPTQTPYRSAAHEARAAAAPPAPGHILVVDDEEAIGKYLGDLFEIHGFRVRATTDPLQALADFRAAPDTYDLIITDQTMPGITGRELVRAFAALRPELPVILMTGYSASIDEESAMAAGARAFVHKPVRSDDLLATVSRLLNPSATSHTS